jgi:hypothetical protein
VIYNYYYLLSLLRVLRATKKKLIEKVQSATTTFFSLY